MKYLKKDSSIERGRESNNTKQYNMFYRSQGKQREKIEIQKR